jgi:hypothetical protein
MLTGFNYKSFSINFHNLLTNHKSVVTNNTAQSCFDETTIQFIVDDLPEAFPVPAALTTTCDDEIDPWFKMENTLSIHLRLMLQF